MQTNAAKSPIRGQRARGSYTAKPVGRGPLLLMMLILTILAAWQPAPSRERDAAATLVADVGRLLVGHYDNSAQVAQGKKTRVSPAPQHVTITIEPTRQAKWELWRIHMDVDPA